MPLRIIHRPAERHVGDVHSIYEEEWWTRGRSLEDVRTILANSGVFVGLVREDDDRLIAFARGFSDEALKAVLLEVMVASAHRGGGLGERLVPAVLAHPRVRGVRHVELYCSPAFERFYRRWGFRVQRDVVFMRREQVPDRA